MINIGFLEGVKTSLHYRVANSSQQGCQIGRYTIFWAVFNIFWEIGQVGLIQRFVKFVCLVYTKWWIRCPLPAECGLSDLILLSDIRSYPDVVVSKAAEKALHGHLWYLTQEQAPRCLFSS